MFDIFNMIKKDKSAARKVTRQTIIGDILDMDQSTAPYFCGDRYALPGLPLLPGRDPGGSLCCARRGLR